MKRKDRKRGAEPEAPAPGRPDWGVMALALLGAAITGYLAWLKLTGVRAALCAVGTGCDIVQSSRYAELLGLPTALWGAALYAAVAGLALAGLTVGRWQAAFLLAAGAAGFSLYMTAISLFVLGAACAYCLLATAVALGLLGLILWRRPPVHGRHSPVRASRLAALGGTAAVGAVLAGAFVFAADSSASAGYQTALARHLAETRAVMYGAFW